MSEIVISGKKYAIIPGKWKGTTYITASGHFELKNFLSKKYLFKQSIIESDLEFSLKELLPLLKNIKRSFGTFLISEEESYTYFIINDVINILRYPGRYGEELIKQSYSVVTYNLDTLKSSTLFLHKNYQKGSDMNYAMGDGIKKQFMELRQTKEVNERFFKLLFYLEFGDTELVDLTDEDKVEHTRGDSKGKRLRDITIVDKKWNRVYAEKTTLVKEFVRKQRYGKGFKKQKAIIIAAHPRTYHKKKKL